MDIARIGRNDARPLGVRWPVSAFVLGIIISGLLIVNALVFRTYQIAMPSPLWETARQIGLPVLLVEIAAILFAMRRGLDIGQIWRSWPSILRGAVVFFLALFWIGGVFYSEMTVLASIQNLIFIVHVLFGMAVFHLMTPLRTTDIRGMAVALSVGLLLLSMIILNAFVNHPPLDSMPDNQINWQFAVPGFISVRLFGAFCGATFCFLLFQMLSDESRDDRKILTPFLWLTLCAAMTIWSGTRNAVLGIMVTAFALSAAYKIRPSMKTVLLLALSVTSAFAIATALIPYNDSAFMLIASQDAGTAESLSGSRASYWTALWAAYTDVPWFGAGPFASFWILPDGAQTHVQPHNIILQFLLSWGLPATLLALAILAYATWKAHCVCFRQRQALPCLAMLDCLLVMSLFDGMAHFAQPLMLMMICFGVIFSTTKCAEASV